MKKRIPSFLAGAITMLLILTLSVTALAASGKITLEVSPIGVLVNGEEFEPKDAQGNDVLVFVYNGTTYAPLRALAEAYGLEVGYDSERGIATVNEPGSTTSANSVPNLSNMDYETFKNSLTLEREIGDLLTAPSSKNISYHYYLTFGNDLNEAEFLKEWEAFSSGNANDYLAQLLQEYAEKAPYNMVSLHIWYNSKELKGLTN